MMCYFHTTVNWTLGMGNQSKLHLQNGQPTRMQRKARFLAYEANCSSVWVAEGYLSNVTPGDSQSESEICLLREKIKKKKIQNTVINDSLGKKRGLYYKGIAFVSTIKDGIEWEMNYRTNYILTTVLAGISLAPVTTTLQVVYIR